jgi:hypothetical protein
VPYSIEKRGSKWCLIRKDGTQKQCHDTRGLAVKARRAIMMVKHGGKGSEKKSSNSG